MEGSESGSRGTHDAIYLHWAKYGCSACPVVRHSQWAETQPRRAGILDDTFAHPSSVLDGKEVP